MRHTISTSADQLMFCVDCGDSLEATLSGAWNGYSWVAAYGQQERQPRRARSQPEITYNIVYAGTTKE